MQIACRHSRGFTLIEIAIAMLIIGLVGVTALTATLTMLEAAREKGTRQNQDAIKVALQNFIARNGRLPCPAVPSDTPTAATFGLEAAMPGTCTGATDIGTGVFGTVPWKSIGISIDNAVDGWNNQFHYAVTKTAMQTNFTTVGTMRGVLTLHNGTPVANGLPATGNQLNACSTTAGDNTCNLLAAVILISHGRNGFGARTWGGVSLPAPTSAKELENTDADAAFVRAERSDVDATAFDDVIMALSPADVLAPLLAQGFVKFDSVALAEKYRQLTASLTAYGVEFSSGAAGSRSYPLPTVSGPIAYALDATKFGGSCDFVSPNTIGLTTYPDMQLIKDPWGNAFRYQRATWVATATESCPTYAAFVSAGPDGVFSTTDDSIHYLSKGEYDSIIALVGW